MTAGDQAKRQLRRAEDTEIAPPLRLVALATPEPRRTVYNSTLKPILDIVLAAAGVVVLSPLMALIALAIRISMGGPVLYRQERVGLGGCTFDVLKFRTMDHDRRQAQTPLAGSPERRRTHKHENDPRHTPLGRVLRKWSLDELPQLFNVLKGEMSIVGPRPELVEIVLTYDESTAQRHRVKPGITGLWQVGARGDGVMHKNPEPDLAYVRRQCLRLDVYILARTPGAIVNRQGS